MGVILILETTFLVDLERELARAREGPAHAFLEKQASELLYVTFTVAGELAAGVSLSERERWKEFLRPFRILAHNEDVAWNYGKVYRYLEENGLLIGANDLWIAASALAYDMRVVTRNRRHYLRVPGLEVADYGA